MHSSPLVRPSPTPHRQSFGQVELAGQSGNRTSSTQQRANYTDDRSKRQHLGDDDEDDKFGNDPDFPSWNPNKTHKTSLFGDITTLTKSSAFEILLDTKLGGWILTKCTGEAYRVGLKDGMHLVSVGGRFVCNEPTLKEEDVNLLIANAPKLTICARPVREVSLYPVDETWRVNESWLEKNNECKLQGLKRIPDQIARQEKQVFNKLEDIISKQLPDKVALHGKVELPLALPGPKQVFSVASLGNMFAKGSGEVVQCILPGVMIHNPPESTLEYCVGPSFLVLSKFHVPGKNGDEPQERNRLFLVTQSNFKKTLTVKESHDVDVEIGGASNFQDRTTGKTMAFPKCEADWRMGEYVVECNTSDQVSVMICDQQILKARLTGRRSIEAALTMCRHQARADPLPQVLDGQPCCGGCCVKCMLYCDWFKMCCCGIFKCEGPCCRCCEPTERDFDIIARGLHRRFQGVASAHRESERLRLFRGPKRQSDVIEVSMGEDWESKRKDRRLAQKVLESVTIVNKIDIAYKDQFNDDVEVFSFYLAPDLDKMTALDFVVQLSRSSATLKVNTMKQSFTMDFNPFAGLDKEAEMFMNNKGSEEGAVDETGTQFNKRGCFPLRYCPAPLKCCFFCQDDVTMTSAGRGNYKAPGKYGYLQTCAAYMPCFICWKKESEGFINRWGWWKCCRMNGIQESRVGENGDNIDPETGKIGKAKEVTVMEKKANLFDRFT